MSSSSNALQERKKRIDNKAILKIMISCIMVESATKNDEETELLYNIKVVQNKKNIF
jgi:hypothetical protein